MASTRRRSRAAITMPVPGRGRALTELRRSNAAGIHGRRRPTRASAKRAAIESAR
jgi:hypothetical protein